LPRGGSPEKPIDAHNVRTVEVTTTGVYALDKQRMSLDQVIARLAADFRGNPNLIVYIRAEKTSPYENVAAVIDRCQKNGITRFRCAPTRRPHEPPAKKMRHCHGGFSFAAAGDFACRPGVFQPRSQKRTTRGCST
jgi:hypothetical protein